MLRWNTSSGGLPSPGNGYKPLFSASPFQAHPLHFALTAILALSSLILYNSRNTVQHYPAVFDASAASSVDLPLSQRLQRSEDAFQRSIDSRKFLWDQYGQDPDSFPTEAPYPPYTVWDFFYPAFNCPFEMERLGCAGDGGKWTCGVSRLAQQRKPVVYSFGINGESSWENEMLKRTDCEIWGYDFSVKSFGPQIESSYRSRTHFFAYGLSGHSDPQGDPPMFTLEALMKQNGHDFVDVLKIDIETSEFSTMDDLIEFYDGKPLPFGQLLIEIHAWAWTHPKAMKLIKWFENLEKAGLRPFMAEPNLVAANYHGKPQLCEYSFINVRGRHSLISDK